MSDRRRRGGNRRPRIRDATWRHLTASVPGRLVEEIDEQVGTGSRSAFVREAVEAHLRRVQDANLARLEASDDAPYTPEPANV
jgi:Arc/MetJ-type ribon-helix-helix transcriptional regulator